MRLIGEIFGLYDRNLITMDEALHYYDLIRQHDMNLHLHNKVVPEMWVYNLKWDIIRKRNRNIKDEAIVDYILEKLEELNSVSRFCDGLQHAKKNWFPPEEVKR